MTAFDRFLEETGPEVDGALDAWIPPLASGGELAAAMRHIVFAGGKRLRPALVFLGCEDIGGQRDEALGAAVAVELVHAYSLVHDDLPCMDDGQLRRGKPCVHRVYGEAMGVLAGDALLTLAFELLAAHTPAHRPVGAMVRELAQAAGADGMVGGQVADLEAEGHAPDLNRVGAIHRRKTAALISASLRLGALAGGGQPDDIQRLSILGQDLGLAFQIVDDLLDVQGTTEQLGKQAGADADREKMTWPSAVGVETARRDARRLVGQATRRARDGRAAELIGSLGETILNRGQ